MINENNRPTTRPLSEVTDLPCHPSIINKKTKNTTTNTSFTSPYSKVESSLLSSSMFSYQKLKHVEEREYEELVLVRKKIFGNGRHGRRWGRSGWSWRRPRVRVAGLLRRVVRGKAAAVRAAMRASLKKMMIRLKEGKPYVGELFAGNYMFMQVNPSVAVSYLDKSVMPSTTRLHNAYAVTPRIAY